MLCSGKASYSTSEIGKREPFSFKKEISSFLGLITREITVPRIFLSAMVPLFAIRTNPSFAAYPKRRGCPGKACSLNLLTGSAPGVMCSISSTQSQRQVSNLKSIFSKKFSKSSE